MSWALAWSGWSRIASRYSAMASATSPGSQGVAEVEVGHGVVGLEPDRLAVCGDGLVELPLGTQGDAEVGVGDGVVGLEPDGLAGGGDGPVEDRRRLGGPAALLQVPPQTAQVPRVLRPSIRQVAEDRLGLGAAAHPLEQVGQLVRRLGQGAGRRVVPHRLLAGRRLQLSRAPARA